MTRTAALDIRAATDADVAVLEALWPSGPTRLHQRRFELQEQGLSTYLIAWRGTTPVGSCSIRWSGCAAPEVRARLGAVPELNGLQVLPPELRGQGIGTAMISFVERAVRSRGIPQVGLGVDNENPRAAALYERLGYRDVGCRYLDRYFYLTPDGERHDVADPCRFLVKDL